MFLLTTTLKWWMHIINSLNLWLPKNIFLSARRVTPSLIKEFLGNYPFSVVWVLIHCLLADKKLSISDYFSLYMICSFCPEGCSNFLFWSLKTFTRICLDINLLSSALLGIKGGILISKFKYLFSLEKKFFYQLFNHIFFFLSAVIVILQMLYNLPLTILEVSYRHLHFPCVSAFVLFFQLSLPLDPLFKFLTVPIL